MPRTQGLAVGLTKVPRKALAVGDSPISVFHPNNINVTDDPDSEIYMPVAKDAVLSIEGGVGYSGVVQIEEVLVNKINGWTIDRSDVIASSSRALASTIRKRVNKRF